MLLALVVITLVFCMFNAIYEITFYDSLDQFIVNYLTAVICLTYIVVPYHG